MWSVEDGVVTVRGDTLCREVEEAASPWLFASDRPHLTVREWIDRGGGDLLWGLLGPTRAQVLGLTVLLADGRRVRFGGRVVKNVAGYDLTRAFVGAGGALGRVVAAHLRLRPPPRGWRAALRRGTDLPEALTGPGCAVWTGEATWRFLRRGEETPPGYDECDPLAARAALRKRWRDVASCRPLGTAEGIVLAGPRMVGCSDPPPSARGPLWDRLEGALA
ncbi:MAG: FAD-binding oxidoreductase [Planctomycetota bacterium]